MTAIDIITELMKHGYIRHLKDDYYEGIFKAGMSTKLKTLPYIYIINIHEKDEVNYITFKLNPISFVEQANKMVKDIDTKI